MTGIATERDARELEGDVSFSDKEALAKVVLPMIADEWRKTLAADAEKAVRESMDKAGDPKAARNTRRLPGPGVSSGFDWSNGDVDHRMLGFDLDSMQSAQRIINRDPRRSMKLNPADFLADYTPGFKVWNGLETPDGIEKRWKSLGEFLIANQEYGSGHAVDPRYYAAKQYGIRNALNEGTGAEGAFLVPEEFRAILEALTIEGALLEPLMLQIPMTSESLRFPYIRDESHADGSVFGGIKFVMMPEGGDVAPHETEPTFADLILRARKLMGYTVVSNDLLKDSAVALESLILQKYPMASTWKRESLFLNGNDNGQPLGIVNSPALIQAALETGQSGHKTVTFANINQMYAQMLPTSRGRGIWLCNMEVWPQIAQMAVNVGTGGSAVFITGFPGQTAAQTPPATIYGRPLYVTEHCSALGDLGDILYVDPSYLVLGDRQDLEISSSPHVQFTQDRTVWRFLSRFDSRPWIDTALTPEHGTLLLSPFVGLKAR